MYETRVATRGLGAPVLHSPHDSDGRSLIGPALFCDLFNLPQTFRASGLQACLDAARKTTCDDSKSMLVSSPAYSLETGLTLFKKRDSNLQNK